MHICSITSICVYVWQNLGEIPNLHGVEEDPTISEETGVRVSGYKAFRWVSVLDPIPTK